MSPDRAIAMVACSLCLGTAALAVDEEAPEPEADFLEYLGMWQESDEEWLVHDEMQTIDEEERSDPVPEGEESTEINDES